MLKIYSHSGDYGGIDTVTVEQAAEQINYAEQFVGLAQNLIGSLPPP
ncbi:hypothetical protein QUB68_20605 [Microcoleus sp. A006_D1]